MKWHLRQTQKRKSDGECASEAGMQEDRHQQGEHRTLPGAVSLWALAQLCVMSKTVDSWRLVFRKHCWGTTEGLVAIFLLYNHLRLSGPTWA